MDDYEKSWTMDFTSENGISSAEVEQDAEDYDPFSDVQNQLTVINARLDKMSTGIDQIGGMMNWVAESVGKAMTDLQSKGIGGILGMLGKGNG